MALELYDRVKETSTTTGTGTLTLAGAVTGYRTFGSVLADADTTYYAIELSGSAEWEVGLGTIGGSGTTLARTTPLASSNAGAAVNFSAGTKNVFVTTPAALFSTAVATFLVTPSSANLASLLSDDAFSMSDAELGALAGLTSAADKVPYFTGSGTAALADLSANMRTFLTTPSSANLATLVSDDVFSLSDVELGAIAGLTSAADKIPYFTGSGTAALADLSSAMRTFLTTPSSANFASLVTGETGTGALVFGTNPSLTLPLISVTATLTALGTTQGTAATLPSDVNIVTTSTGANNGVILPTAVAGYRIVVVNQDAADVVTVYPNTSDQIDALAANTGISLPVGATMEFFAISASQWYTTMHPAEYAVGDILYASSASVLSKLAGVATGNALISGGVATAPSWNKIGLTTHVSGTLPVANGGTNASTFTAGSVVFAGASGTYTQDNANFFWDDSNNRLGIGTASPAYSLDVAGNLNGSVQSTIRNASTGASASSQLIVATGTANSYITFTTFDASGAPYAALDSGSAVLSFNNHFPIHRWRGTGGTPEHAYLSAAGYRIGTGGVAATSLLMVDGAISSPGVVVTGNTTLDGTHSYVCNNRGASNTITLPAASTCEGREYHFQTMQAQTVVSASSNILQKDGSTTSTAILPATDGAWCTIKAVASTWRVIRSGT